MEGLSVAVASSTETQPQASSQRYSYGPLLVEGPSHSHGVQEDKKGISDYVAKVNFYCFNMGRKNPRERERDRK
jgi:hypothetical protein